MSDDCSTLAEALTVEFTYNDKLDDYAKGLYYVERWQLMNLPDEGLPPAEIVETTPAWWEAPDLEKSAEFQKWRRMTSRRVQEEVFKKLKENTMAAEEECGLVERKLSALDWLQEACRRSAQVWRERVDKGIRTANRHADSLGETSFPEGSELTLEAIKATLEQESDTSRKRILNTEIGRAIQARKRLEMVRKLLQEIPRVRAFLNLQLQIYRKAIAHVKAGRDPETLVPKSTAGRSSRLENPSRVMDTLDTVCEWLDTDPPPIFKGNDGLVDFASEKFPHLTDSGVRDRIRQTFAQLARKYPDLPSPDLDTGTNGRIYLENEEEIRTLREEYETRFVEK